MSGLEIFLAITGLIYVILASQNKRSCWIFGILSSGVLAYVSATEYKLYSDAALNVFYVFIGAYALWIWWREDQDESDEGSIRQLTTNSALILGLLGILLTLSAGMVLSSFSDAFATYWDAGTTVFSIIATVLLVKRYLENWYLWVVIDLVMIALYLSRGGYATAALFGVYVVVAIYGALEWRKLWRAQGVASA